MRNGRDASAARRPRDFEHSVQEIDGVVLRCDASARNRDRSSRWACIASYGTKLIWKCSGEVLDERYASGAFGAELWAVLVGLRFLWTKGHDDKAVCVMSDSSSVIRCLNGQDRWPDRFRPLGGQIGELASKFSCVTFVWIPRRFNSEADRLASLRDRKSTDFTSKKWTPPPKPKRWKRAPWRTGIYPEITYRRSAGSGGDDGIR